MSCVAEIFQLTLQSNQEDLDRCINRLQTNFYQKTFQSISLIIKKIKNDQQNATYKEDTNTTSQFMNQSLLLMNQSQSVALENQNKSINMDKSIIDQTNKPKIKQEVKEIQKEPENTDFNKEASKETFMASEVNILDTSLERNFKLEQQKKKQLIKIEENGGDDESYKQEEPEKDQIIVSYNKGLELFKEKRFEEALDNFQVCLNLVQNNKEMKDLNLYEVGCNQYIGSCLIYSKNSDQAVKYLDKALQLINDKYLEKDPNQMYSIYNTLAYCYNEKKDYVNMIQHWENAKEYLEQLSDTENQKNMGHLLNSLGMAYFGSNNLKKAQQYFKKSVQIYQEIFGEFDISVGNRMNNLAEAYRNDEQFSEALKIFQQSLEIKRKHFKDDNDKSIANTLNNIGMTYQNLKQPGEAIQYFKQSVEIYKVLYGKHFQGDQASTIANVLNCLGDCYKSMGKPDSAFKYYQDSYDLKKSIYGFDHKNTMHTTLILAQMLFMSKKYEQSVQMFKELLAGQTKIYGENSLQVGQTLNNLGTVLHALKLYDEALIQLERAVNIFQQNGTVPITSIQKIKNYIDTIKKKK